MDETAPELLQRSMILDVVHDKDDDDGIFEFSFSSEYPFERHFGLEVLDHSPGAPNLERLNNHAPLCWNHDPSTQIGVVERAWLDESKRRLMCQARFSRSPFAQEKRQDLVDGILRNVSHAYSIDEPPVYEDGTAYIKKWTPYEVSLVPIPVDYTVGIGRSRPTNLDSGRTMPANEKASGAPEASTQQQVDIDQVRSAAMAEERTRVAGVTDLCRTHGFDSMCQDMIERGVSVSDAQSIILDGLAKRSKEPQQPAVAPAPAARPIAGAPAIVNSEVPQYGITTGIRAALTGDWSSREAGYVRELSQEVGKSLGRPASSQRSFFVPFGALAKRATYVTSGATTGGNLVETDLLADQFIEFLRNSSIMMSAGVQSMPGLVGDVAIPRRSGVATTYYLTTETTTITQSESTFDQVSMTPKHLAALSKYSRQTLLQGTPGIEQLVRADLADGIRVEMDRGILAGSGASGQPTGILNTSGIGSVALGTNGGDITIESMNNLMGTIDIVNGIQDSFGYVTNAKVVNDLSNLRAGGSAAGNGPFLWNTQGDTIGRGPRPSSFMGFPLWNTNNAPSNLTKGTSSGVCSAVLAGDFSKAMVGIWGQGLEISLGEDGNDFSQVLTSVRATVHYDVAVRDPKHFAAILDVTTTL